MKNLYRVFVQKAEEDKLSIKSMVLVQPYEYDMNMNTYKCEVNIGGTRANPNSCSLEGFIPINDFLKNFFIKDLNKITTKQRSLIFYNYKQHLNGNSDNLTLLTVKEVAQLFDMSGSYIHQFLRAIPENLKPILAYNSKTNNHQYLFNSQDIKILEKAIDMKKYLTYKGVTKALNEEYNNTNKTKPKETKKVRKGTTEFLTQLMFKGIPIEIGNYQHLKITLDNGEVLIGTAEKGTDNYTLELTREVQGVSYYENTQRQTERIALERISEIEETDKPLAPIGKRL